MRNYLKKSYFLDLCSLITEVNFKHKKYLKMTRLTNFFHGVKNEILLPCLIDRTDLF